MSKIGYPFTFHQSQTPPTVTDEEVEEVPIDTGLIRCICESTEDDGFTIQCDKCLTWQHAFCMNIKQDNIPDRYLCNDCVKVVASLNSQRSSKNNNNNTTQDIDTIGLIHTKSHSNNTTTTKRKEDKNKSGHNSNKSLSVKSNSHNKRSREMAVQEDYRSPIHTKTTTSKKPKLSKRITMSKRSLQQQQQQQNNMDSDDEEVLNKNNIEHTHNNNDNDSHQSDNITLHVYQKPIKHHHHHHHHNKKKEKHHHIDFNTISSKFVHEIMKDTIKRWSQSSKWKSQPWRDADQQDIATSSTSRKHQQQHHHHHPSNEPFIVMDTTSLQQSSLNHISIQTLPKQQLSSAYGHRTTSTSSSFSPLSSSRLRKGVFADTQLNANAFLMEVHGEILLKTEYKFDVANDYAILGTACAHVLFYPTLDLCIDSRQLGNDARYFRRSCHPNAELRTMVFPSSTSNDTTVTATSTLMDQGDHHKSIRLGVFTRTAINEGEEITLGWNWQKGHISWRKNVEWYRSSSQSDTTTTTQNRTFSHDTKEDSLQHYKYNQHKIDEKLELKSQYAIEQMIEKFDDEFGSCACGDRDVCLIEQLRLECFNYHHDKNIDMNLQANGSLSDNLELTSLPHHQETGKTLQHSRQIIVTPSNNNSNSNLYKMGNEKATTATINSPAPGSVEDNIDIDVTSMSPITRSPVLTNPILAQVKKAATLDGDDELDIDSDIDIGEEIPNTADAPMNKEKEKNEEGKKLSTGQDASPISSSSSGISDLESANSGSVGDDHNDSNKKRKLMVKSESKEDSHGNIVLWKKSMVTNKKPSVLPFKKAWSKNFSQRDLKLDNDTNKTSTLIVSDIKIQEKSYISSSTTKLDISSSSASYGSIPNQHNNNSNSNSALMKSGPSSNNKTETDLDDGELSDASSASTIPLEEDDRNWSLRSANHKLTTSGLNNQPDTITSVHKNNNSNNLESSSSSPSSPITTSVDTTNKLQQHNNNNNNSNNNNNNNNENSNNNNDITNAVVDKDSKNYISDTKSISPNNINDPSKNQPELVSSSLSSPPPSTITTTTTNISTAKNESSFSSSSPSPSVTHLEINDNKDVDQSKPTKVKVSLQEYLSRRLANQDPPSQ